MSAELQAKFEQAKTEVTQLSKAPDSMAMLRLYALFKQSTAGDCTGDRPGMLNPTARYKYDAWKALEGTSNDAAMQQYIDYVEELKAADKA